MTRAAMLLIVLAACGGGTATQRVSAGPGGPVDPAAMRALLAKYSPSGQAIVTAYEPIPTKVELVDGPMEITHSQGFDDFFPDGATEHVVTYMATAVHETTHGYTAMMALQLLAERGLRYGDGADAILADGDPWLVQKTAVFPTSEIDATFPDDARTFDYGVYVTSSDPTSGTQQSGIYGLLDELAAYYQDARVTVDFWPWVRDVAPADSSLAINYALAIDELWVPYTELSLYILHSLLYARDHAPEIYDALLASADFKGAFLAVHDAYEALLPVAAELAPAVDAFALTRGVTIEHRDGVLYVDGNPLRAGDHAPYAALRAHLASDAYQSVIAALR